MKRVSAQLAAVCMAFLLLMPFMAFSQAEAGPMPAPAFSGLTVDGKPFSSSSLKGKAYIVNFFASWCPPCRSEIPDMVQVQKAFASKGFTFVGIAVNERPESVKGFMKSNGVTWPVLMATPDIIRSYSDLVDGGITGIPTSFVVDTSGKVTGVIVGPRSKEMFEQIIRTSLKTPPVK